MAFLPDTTPPGTAPTPLAPLPKAPIAQPKLPMAGKKPLNPKQKATLAAKRRMGK
jgi:hypothetical protein